MSFTPCVYPLMPITASFIAGINTEGSRLQGFFLSVIYVFGVALAYCTLAVVASFTGMFFGQIQNTPAVHFIVGAALLFFSLVMFDVIALPNLGVSIHHKIKPKNIFSVVLFGVASGLVIGPCTAPVLGTLLGYVAGKQNIVHAVSLMFVFSYGVGASLILVGTFSSLIAHLPKSGAWLIRIKQFCAAVILLAAIYYFYKGGSLWWSIKS